MLAKLLKGGLLPTVWIPGEKERNPLANTLSGVSTNALERSQRLSLSAPRYLFGGHALARLSWQQLERTCKTWTDPNRPKIPTVSCQNSVDTSPFSNSCNRSVDETQVELLESSVELERSNHVKGNGRLRSLVSRICA